MTAIPDPDLTAAFERIEAFLAVQSGVRGARLVAAVDCLQAAAGIGAQERSQIAWGLSRLESLDPRTGDVMLGVIVGLLAAAECEVEPFV
jgi:uncharacterized membrane protein